MDFYIVDVFAEEKYQGNQLAVLVPDSNLTMKEMQQIAKEINFSETTFIMSNKQENGGYDVRIFTPDAELPFAGHPTLGTAYIINRIMENGNASKVVLNLPVGQIPVIFNGDTLTMSQNEPSFGMKIDQFEFVARVLNIQVEDIRTDYPIQQVSTGLPCIIVPLKAVDAVQRCSIDHVQFKRFLDTYYYCNLLVFSEEESKDTNCLRVRVFMDNTGFYEDPATGSANGNLAGYLLKYRFFNKENIDVRVNQGYEMGRPSRVNIQAKLKNGTYDIQVSGKVQLVAKGDWLSTD
ncbi:phenazine biosynthesis protein [Paenibacillus albidus]|uniref:Phenazine biosynthesis protein n=1 Tax=Paenibacillus albidus TaxID=2041023 RepID=A0A917FZF2_9BACL|nr:PhzF family phenazine biosynthesis protein [Paenibacillus albidus]MBT2292824.1 PhzF family phenazine biosynthesis protein [Paenibacillus albidus]GGG15182.1 phenazine biosynthesis protein [Paenibacillus albidus]